ncbi:sensor histidine kinase [Oceanirhabdus sp. W0125-5]|uniref:sensor histidine kinase n=1 Tax=Oceanirhabdus sp. W0125-5 TaxID=2999116 RepID=UPI0022F2D4C2|nr:HAMP domain-containing sensor histidine kinase [Oceanirhabdus sp. W0125-5]WBW96342.1 HAMP domain-containing sensor histidine kinase [Oceanirhabdus sp. W0125-5]
MKSITMKWMLAIVFLLTILIGSLMFVNTVFLEKYYIFKTKTPFVNEYKELLEEYHSLSNGKFLNALKSRSSDTEYKYRVINEKYDVVLSSAPEFQEGDKFPLARIQKEFILKNKKELTDEKIFYETLKSGEIDQYDITLIAKLGKDHFLMITKPLRQVSENLSIANDFIIIIGIGILIIGVLIAYLMSRRMVKPVLEITEITSRIAHLDFSERYQGTLKDEVGTLGESINRISEKLHWTISDLKQVNADLEKEIQLQKRFLASVSHEFKTPVGLIRGYTESLHLDMAKDKKEEKEFTSIILKETDHLNRLISDIIFLMHIESGIFQMHMKDFDLSRSIQEMVNKHSQVQNEKPIEFLVEIPSTLNINGDEGRLIQVLENLISNGIRHVTPEGILRITAKKYNNLVRVEIFNSGEQIPLEHLPQLFDAFYSAQDSRSRNKGGTGLGLSIVNSIIHKHNGECGVLNKDDGVVFWFTLPISD